ncbi:MAG: indolepyruvate ferredoxin oxidoreductase subunit alpha, partial [Selenomonadaceae bacterium]|nr:indolepyruvate ferredoxin oxidoreductase subunit alpha [Selenomonadaceae bacterium]
GTPSTEVLETVAKRNPGNIHVEWSVNEKAAMEVAAGAAYSGARAMVTMKQVGLNVASDPLMSLEYVGIKGGMVVMVADDPGPISSQTEQDTRTFAMFAKVPVFDPSSVSEAYEMIQEAFDFSEKYGTPVFFRCTTRVDHGYEAIDVKDAEEYRETTMEGFVKDSSRWVIFPRLSLKNHGRIEKRNRDLTAVLSEYPRNGIRRENGSYGKDSARKGIASHGISYMYTLDALDSENHVRLLKVATPFPFPEELALRFLDGLDEVLCIEELDPVIERALLQVCGKHHLSVKIRGKLTGDIASAGENTLLSVSRAIHSFLGLEEVPMPAAPDVPLPVRPPVLCAGCPHRASFYAVKQAMKGQKTIYCGDIGCYTLGNAMPLDMCDTCLCMGAGINIAQGIGHLDGERKCFAFVGDSTFFAAGITGVVNAFYNQADMTLVVLDNSTTAMTGHQPHPGTGRTAMGQVVEKVSIEKVLHAIGITTVETVNPLDFGIARDTIRRVAEEPGVKAVIFRSPCIAMTKPAGRSAVDAEKCIGCRKCIRELGCPALILKDEKAFIDATLCTGCTLCEQVCPVGAIGGGKKNEE